MPLDASTYEKKRDWSAGYSHELAARGREIGAIPAVVDPARKSACERDFRLFCGSYFAEVFTLPWSDDHLRVIGQIEQSVLGGGLFATAMPRGSGKTSLCEVACIWAVLYGHRDFVVMIGNSEDASRMMLDSVKTEFESNRLLLEDFPEAVYPIVSLQGIIHRCRGQLCGGKLTYIDWTAGKIVMPTIGGSRASGAVIDVTGITGNIRGMKFKKRDGTTIRPSLAIIDDPQTDESARSPSQCEGRERVLSGAILGLAGPGRKISGIMPCTVIHPGDMADRILDRQKHPEWQGTRTKLVYSFPTDEKLWEQYARIRQESLRAERGGREATEFYRANRPAMDAGSRVAWEARHDPDELSAIQHAMNLKIDRPRAFHAEYQNEPLLDQDSRPDDLTPDQIAGKMNRLPRGLVPVRCSRLTSFVDVQGSLLYYVVCAWVDDFTGFVIDYGTFPDQKSAYFTLQDARDTLQRAFPRAGLEGQLRAGLEALCGPLLAREWARDDGSYLKVERLLVDANWGPQTQTIYEFCRQGPSSTLISPSHGKYIGAGSLPMAEYARRPGDKVGFNWRITAGQQRGQVRRVLYDTNFWKSFIHTRLSVAMGDRGCLSLFGTDPKAHRCFADHLCSEYRVETEGRGRKCDEWKSRPERPDNHWFDCLVGCAVAASIQGAALAEARPAGVERKRGVTFADFQARQRGARP